VTARVDVAGCTSARVELRLPRSTIKQNRASDAVGGATADFGRTGRPERGVVVSDGEHIDASRSIPWHIESIEGR
jgi:hypothetical protein